MPKFLIVRMSSMGDLIHTLPVITDIREHFPDAQIDWVAEEAYVELPRLHPGVNHVISIALRRWRKQLWKKSIRQEMRAFLQRLEQDRYDAIIDPQGLLKSVWVCKRARGPSCAFDKTNIRDKFALPFYDKTFAIPKTDHVITKNRKLAGLALGYTPSEAIHYGIRNVSHALDWLPKTAFACLLVNTARAAKEWETRRWVELGNKLHQEGIHSVLTWGSATEKARAEEIAKQIPNCTIAPKLSLMDATSMLSNSMITIGVDTGFTHIANAVETPTIAIFCDSDPNHAGVIGDQYVANLGGIQVQPSVDEVWQHVANALHLSSKSQ
ncbi:lipopolysaccharide heptosyltransferase I [Leeia sp. TBRC 13508]|uniref:Lipopolysaccharide heptosyltransferase 1 n=1 Tax=Leeia speluncae TaxID=2884804 RepID=A0ABS8D359_9NEIS|nr:lipopolysaccharide heptosyltransferase I [Leeia speluncae]MCB6182592.1 lipopolysaccharide heptosyltransferase I [Leeia speluncae]